MNETIILRRFRARVEPAAVAPIATALVTGMPAPTINGANRQTEKMRALLNNQWKYPERVSLPGIQPNHAGNHTADALSNFLSGTGDFYVEFFVFVYRNVSHMHAAMWENVPSTTNTLCMETHSDIDALFATSRSATTTAHTRQRDHYTTPRADELTDFIFRDNDTAPGTEPADPRLLAETCTVKTVLGPDLTDPVWISELPLPGEDISFDTIYPDDLVAEYRLHRKN